MRIPSTIEGAVEALSGIESLLTAKGWERAAILAAFVRLPGQGARSDLATSSQVLSPNEFAALGIAGLRSKDTIRAYVQSWLDAHDGIYPEPGAEVELPTGDYPPGGPRGNTQKELIDSAARKGTLTSMLTPEQKVEVAAEVLKEATTEDDRETLKAIREQAGPGVLSITTKPEFQEIIRNQKHREAVTKKIDTLRPSDHVKMDALLWLGDDIEEWQESANWFAERVAEFAVDGKIANTRGWAK